MKITKTYDYSKELDILHVYNEDIVKGIKGSISGGFINVDIGQDDKVVGVELESASKVLNISSETLSHLDKVNLGVRRLGNGLLIGMQVSKGVTNSFVQFSVNTNNSHLAVPN